MWTTAQHARDTDDGRRYPSDLTDAQWASIAPLFTDYDAVTVALRELDNACPWPAVRSRHDRCRAGGLWPAI